MILPIVAYGSPVLRKVCDDINSDYPGLEKLIADMWETMCNSNGVGLAAPQINVPIRLFVMDSEQIFLNQEEDEKDDYPDTPGYKGVFINAHITKLNGEQWSYNEGCLSIPDVREDVYRKPIVTIQYCEEDFVMKTEVFDGLIARVIQHEYDHIEGILFTDKISSLEKRLIQKKLKNIMEGKTFQEYRMKFFAKKGR